MFTGVGLCLAQHVWLIREATHQVMESPSDKRYQYWCSFPVHIRCRKTAWRCISHSLLKGSSLNRVSPEVLPHPPDSYSPSSLIFPICTSPVLCGHHAHATCTLTISSWHDPVISSFIVWCSSLITIHEQTLVSSHEQTLVSSSIYMVLLTDEYFPTFPPCCRVHQTGIKDYLLSSHSATLHFDWHIGDTGTFVLFKHVRTLKNVAREILCDNH